MNHVWQRLFVGRDTELGWLHEAWHKAKQGDPQFVVLLGESGLGKTRLVQEFYRWLSCREDPLHSGTSVEGYWPDAFNTDAVSLDVNPKFAVEDNDRRPPIPWLWWGLRWENPGERNEIDSRCAISTYRGALLAHVAPLLAARKLNDMRKDVLWKIGTELCSLYSFLPGIKEVLKLKDVWKLVQQYVASHELHDQRLASPGQALERERTELKTLALDFFRTVLDPSNKEATTVPVVLLLDDAQWADPDSLDFVQQLLTEAIAKHWPLLVIATHWEQEWNYNLQVPFTPSESPKRLTDVFARLTEHGGRQVCILPRVANLSAVVQSALPGATHEQQQVILAKADGNPLLLEQLLGDLFDEERNFVDGERSAALTERATHELREAKGDLHRVVEKRFKRLEKTVRRALGWSSRQGMRFLTRVTEAIAAKLAPELPSTDVVTALQAGETPHSLIQFIDAGRCNLGLFRQRVFHEIAENDLKFSSEDTALVDETVRATLLSWLRSDEIDELPEAERQDALLMARHWLKPNERSSDNDWTAWGQALMKLTQLLQRDYLWDQALGAAREFADSRPGGWPIALVPSGRQIDIIDLLHTLSDYPRAARLLLALKDEVSELNLDDDNNLRELGRIYERLGIVQFESGRHQTALVSRRQSVEIDEELFKRRGKSPDRETALGDLSTSLARLGDAEYAIGNRDVALARYDESLELAKRLVTEFGESLGSLSRLGSMWSRIGDVEFDAGNRDSALAHFHKSLELDRQAVRAFGESVERLKSLCVSLNKVGDIELDAGNLDGARACYCECLELAERIVTEFGGTPSNLSYVIASLHRLGDVERNGGDLDAAQFTYNRSLELAERIVTEFGGFPDSLRELSISLNKVADAELVLEKWDCARNHFHESLKLFERIVAEFGETPTSLRDLALCEFRMSLIEEAEDRNAAIRRLERASQIIEQITAKGWGTPQDAELMEFFKTRLSELISQDDTA